MATNTPNLNLVKPEMSDYADIRVLNGNMDILDTTISDLDYVKNVTTSNTVLTFTKKDDSQINVPLDYMPTTGGNFTGDITVKGESLYHIVEVLTDTSNPIYNLKSIKYSDGTLKNVTTIKKTTGVITVTFLTPFVSVNDVEAYSVRYANKGLEPILQMVHSIANLTTTSFQTASASGDSTQQTTILGRWK